MKGARSTIGVSWCWGRDEGSKIHHWGKLVLGGMKGARSTIGVSWCWGRDEGSKIHHWGKLVLGEG